MRTQGSSEAIMLGALSLEVEWCQRREQAGKDTTRPNLVFGVRGINDLLVRLRDERGLDVPLHVDGASGGFVWKSGNAARRRRIVERRRDVAGSADVDPAPGRWGTGQTAGASARASPVESGSRS